MTYFDLTNLNIGDTFVVTSTTSLSNTEFSDAFEQVIGLTFDTAVVIPEPSSALLGALGLLALLRRRRA